MNSRRRAGPQAAAAGSLGNTLYGLLTQAITSAFTAGLTIYLARTLGARGYGVLSLALTIGTLALLTSDAGISYSAARFVAERHDDPPAVAGIAAAALRLNLAASTLFAAGLWVLAPTLAHAFGTSSLVWPVRGVALAVIGQSVLLLYLRVYSALRRVALGVRVVFLESLVETAASVLLVALGAGVTGAAFGRAAGYAVGGTAAFIVARRAIGRRDRSRAASSGEMRAIARYAGPLLITNGAYTLYSTVDSVLIGAILNAGLVGLFTAPMRLVTFLGYVGESVAGAVAPRVARVEERLTTGREWNDALRLLIVFQGLLVAVPLVWPGQLVTLILGPQFRPSTEVMRVASFYIFLAGLSPFISSTVNYLGAARHRIPVMLFTLGLNTLLDVLLLPRLGVLGAAVGTTVAYALYVPAHLRICRRFLVIPLVPLGRTLLRSGLAMATMAALLLALGTGHLTAVDWVVGLTVGPMLYVAVLLLTREISVDDLRGLLRLIGGRLGRSGGSASEVAQPGGKAA